jgi:hypothetical protein
MGTAFYWRRCSKICYLRTKDVEIFAKPTPKKFRALKKGPIFLRGYVSAKAARKPRKRSSEEKEGETLNMPDKEAQINFDAPATLRKWPSLNNERVSASLGARPYLIIDGTLDECIRKFMAMPVGQHHLYEIHTAAQSDLVEAVLSPAHIAELARLRDFL